VCSSDLTIGDGLRVVVGMFTGNEDLVAEGMQGLQGRLSQIWESIVSQTVGATDGMWAQVTGAFNTGVAFVGSIPTRLVEFFKSLPTQFESIGRLIVQGLINGITGMAANAVRSVTSLSASMLSGMKNWLGIKSPSRVFRDQVGAQIAAGVIAGVDGMQVATQASIQSLVTVPQVDAGEGAGASIEINANGVDPMTTALLVKRELGALLAVR
jgi:phage-related protein